MLRFRFLTVFISVIPYQTAVYVMDAFFADGARVIFQLALTVLAKNEAFLLGCADDGNENDIFLATVKNAFARRHFHQTFI